MFASKKNKFREPQTMITRQCFRTLAVTIVTLQLTLPTLGGSVTLIPTEVSVCAGAMVTFTCTVTEENLNSLSWVVSRPTQNDGPESDTFHVVSNIGILVEGQPTNFSTGKANFIVVLVSSNSTIYVTTLTTIASSVVDDATFRCDSDNAFGEASLALSIDNAPAAPQSVTTTNVVYHNDTVTVTIQWNASLLADTYTATIDSDVNPPQILITSNTSFETILSYNTEYHVSIQATNCVGDSSVASATILEIGCGPPSAPINGLITDFVSSEIGAEVSFQCNSGLQPDNVMGSVCTSDGIWNPEPADTECSDTDSGQGLSRAAVVGTGVGAGLGAFLVGSLTAFVIGYCIYSKTCKKKPRAQEREHQYDTIERNEAYESPTSNTREYETLPHIQSSNPHAVSADYYLVGESSNGTNQLSTNTESQDHDHNETMKPNFEHESTPVPKHEDEYEMKDNTAYESTTSKHTELADDEYVHIM